MNIFVITPTYLPIMGDAEISLLRFISVFQCKIGFDITRYCPNTSDIALKNRYSINKDKKIVFTV